MGRNWKYIGAILGTVIGMLCAWNIQYFGAFWEGTPVPFAIIGYATGALLEDKKSS
jgi:hypothetical protein